MHSCPPGQLNAAGTPFADGCVIIQWTRLINKGVCMADRDPNRVDQSDEITRGSADEQIRGVADEADEDFDDAEDLDDEEEEDEEGTV